MTTKAFFTAIAAAATLVAGATSFSPAAEAHGIRLGFGVPLGSFVARPYAPDSYHQRSHSRRSAKQHKSYAAARAEREARAAESARVKAARRAERARQLAAAKAAERAEASRELAKVNKPLTDTGIETSSVTPATAETPTTDVAAVTPAVSPAEEVKAVEPVTTTAEATKPEPQAEEPVKEQSASKKRDCKKFIPAVGVTISVGC